MSHSKRNTSRAVFTSYERELAKAAWGASSARLSRESFLPFASCSLCLESAIDPVACPAGDVFCRECALSNILAQKQEIKRAERALRAEERDARDLKALAEREAHERAVREFELTQAGLDDAGARSGKVAAGSKGSTAKEESGVASRVSPERRLEEGSNAAGAGRKRRFELDEDEVARIAAEDRARARRKLDSEKAAKPKLPSFWVPTVTPTSNEKDVLHEVKRTVKTQPVCPSSTEDNLHYYSLRSLVAIRFTEEDEQPDASGAPRARICPSCRKALANSLRPVMAKPCGHVLCGPCVKQFMTPSGKVDPHAPDADPHAVRCFVCEEDVTERPRLPEADQDQDQQDQQDKKKKKKNRDKDKDAVLPGLVELRSEGTGFSASGANKVKKVGVAFQC